MPITVNDNLQNNSPRSLDNKYSKISGASSVPYESVAEANSTIPLVYRYIGLTVLINDNPVTEYWYRGGTSDEDLVKKFLETEKYKSGTSNVDFSMSIPEGKLLSHIVVNPTLNLTNLIIGTTNGGEEILPAIFGYISSNSDSIVQVNKYFRSASTIYFGNVTSNTEFILIFA